MDSGLKLAIIKAKIPKSLKDFVVSESNTNGISIRTFMVYLVKGYRNNLLENNHTVIENNHTIIDDVLSFTCNDNTEVELNFQIDRESKKEIKISAAKYEVSEKLFVIGAIKRYMNDRKYKDHSEDNEVEII